MAKFIRHDSCPACGSKDNLAVYDDGEYCFSEGCDYKNVYNTGESKPMAEPSSGPLTPLPASSQPALRIRGIDSAAVNKYLVTSPDDPDSNIEAVFPRFSQDGHHIGNQVRYAGKQFKVEGTIKGAQLFGQTVWPENCNKSITVTEGYYDTMAAFMLTGSRYPNVGVMSASSAKKEVVENFEYLNSFEKIVLCFDNDEPGQKAAKEVAQLFDPGKVAIMKLEKAKDANAYLEDNLGREFTKEWFNAPVYMPDGLQLGNDPKLLEEIVKYKDPPSVPYPWPSLNKKTFGMRRSELVLWTADTGIGKTSILKEVEYSLLTNKELIDDDIGVGFLHLEEPKRDLALGLMSIHNNKPYHFPDVERTEEELTEAYRAVVDTDRVVIWDHFGSNDIDVVLAKIRHMAALGCRYIMVDHLSIIVSDQSGDERKQLDEISTKIKTLTMNLDICVHCVIHINRQGQVRGSAGPEQVANCVIRLERNKTDRDPWRSNVTRLTVEKNRRFGRTGPATWLWYDEVTGRLEELTDDLVEAYENGEGTSGNEFELMRG